MFKYTPKKNIVREMDVPKVGRWWDKEFFKRKDPSVDKVTKRRYN